MAIDNLASIGIRVFVDDSASRALFGVNNQLATMRQLTTGVALAFGLFAGGLIYAAVQGADIASALTQVQLATGLTTAQLAQLQPYLLNLGGTSIFSLQQLSAGMATLGQYSYKTVPAIEALSNAGTKLAEATGTLPVDAFRLLATTMQAFNIPANQANYVASLLFYSFEHGTPNVTTMTTALGQLGGAASFLHIPLSEIIPALDTITIGVGSASTAAAGLRFFLNNITGSSAAARAEFAALGITAFNAAGQFVGLPSVLEQIDAKLKTMSEAARYAEIEKLFNIRSGTAVKQLLDQLDAYAARVRAVSDASRLEAQLDAAVAAVMGNVGNIMTVVTSNFRDFAGEVGLQVLPMVIAFLQNGLLPLVTQLRLAAADPAFARAIALFLTLGTAISGVGLAVLIAMNPIGQVFLIAFGASALLAGGIEFLMVHWNQIAAAFQRAVPVLQAVGLGLIALGSAIAAIAITPFLIELGEGIGSLIGLGLAATINAVPGLIAFAGRMAVATGSALAFAVMNADTLIPQMIETATQFTVMAAKAAAMAVVNFVTLLPSILATAGAWLLAAAAELIALAPYILIAAAIAGAVIGLILLLQHLGFLHVILSVLQAAWAAILPAIRSAADMIKTAFLNAVEQLRPVWAQLVDAFNQAKPGLVVLGAILGTLLVIAIGIFIATLRGIITVLAFVITGVIEFVAALVRIFTGVVQVIVGIVKVFIDIFTGNFKNLGTDLQGIWTGITNIFGGAWDAIKAVFVNAFRAILGFITGFIQGIISFFVGLYDRLVGHSLIPDMLAAIVMFFAGLPGRVLSAIGNFIGMVGNFFHNVWNSMMDASRNGILGLLQLAASIPGRVIGALGNLGSLLVGAGQALIQGFINGIGSMFSALGSAVQGLLGSIRNLFPHSPVKEGPLVGYEDWMPVMIRTMKQSVDNSAPSLHASMQHVAQGIQQGILSTAGGGAGGTGGGTAQFQIMLDGKVIYDNFVTRMRNGLQMQGVGRMLQ